MQKAMECSTRENLSDRLKLQIKFVLYKLISPNFRLTDDTVLEKLFDSISQVFFVDESQLPYMEIFLPWIQDVIKEWKEINKKCLAFALKVFSLICNDEKNFSSVLKSTVLEELIQLMKNSEENNLSVILAYLELIHSLVKNPTGFSYVIEKDIWKDVLKFSDGHRSLFVQRKCDQIIADIIATLGNKDITVSHNIIDTIILPCISEKKGLDISVQPSLMNKMSHQNICFHGQLNYLNGVITVKEIILKLLKKKISNQEIDLIFQKYHLQDWAYSNITDTNDPRVITELSKLLCALTIANLPRLDNGNVDFGALEVVRHQFLEHCSLLIKKQQFIILQEICLEYFKLWNNFGAEVENSDESTNNVSVGFENTICIMLSLPLFVFMRIGAISEFDIMEAYAEKIFGSACIATKRIGFAYKQEIIKLKNEMNFDHVSASAIRCFLRIAQLCKKVQAVMIFQTLVHVLRMTVPSEGWVYYSDGTKAPEPPANWNVEQYFEVLIPTFDALHCFITNFNLSWSDSLETVCVMPLLQRLLASKQLPPKLWADVLKLQKVVLLGYLPTNLALLVDSVKDSSMRFLGKQIYRCLHSYEWGVRDSSLELLQAVCTLAEHRLQAFQKLILDEKLPSLVVSMIQNDSEPYVRGSALSCLSQMIKIPTIWDNELSKCSLSEKLFDIVLHNPEGLVRYKAILLLTEIFKCRDLRPEEINKIIGVMYHVSISDLYWEAKKGTVMFWDCVFEKKLSDAGMVDGCFPGHIFSREKRKIIKLTPIETSTSIRRVFDVLSESGCLYSLWQMVFDECDAEVSKEAGKLVRKMIEILKKFNVPINEVVSQDESSKENGEQFSEAMETQKETNGTTQTSDEVIESIVSEGDINLVCSLFHNISPDEKPLMLAERKILSLDQFYSNVISYNIIEKELERAQWLSKTSDGISSLLDDIVISNQYEQTKDIIVDCY